MGFQDSLAIHPYQSLLFASHLAPAVHTDMMNVSFCWLASTGMSMCRSPLENITFEFILTSPACLSHLRWFVRWHVSICTATVLWGAASRIFSALLCSSYIAFSLSILFNLTVVLTWL